MMAGRRSVCVGAGAAIASGILGAGPACADDATVRIGQGALRGQASGGVLAFKGIPYAAPPVGKLRYRSPEPGVPWDGVRDATMAGAASIQTLGGAAAWLYESAQPQSEDCLYLNVWTPGLDGRRPVMVWLHGGAWRTGHGAVVGTNGTALVARGDVVVVTLNYRLGALGWLAHPDLRDPETGAFANWGLQDQIAALRWVAANIAAFGGDPANVTLFGQSAGGSSTASIVQNPDNAGLAHKAIIESGSLHGAPAFPEPATAAAYAEALAQRLSTSVAGLRDVPAQHLHDTELALSRDPALVRRLGRAPVLPVRDGIVLKEWPRDAALPPIPLLIGTTRDEGVFWFDLIGPDGHLVPGLKPPADQAQLVSMTADLTAIYQPESKAAPGSVVARYQQDAVSRGEPTDPRSVFISLYTDAVFRLRALAYAQRHAGAGNPTFLYEFAHPLAPPAHGTPHTAEIPFVFATYADPFFADKVGHGDAGARVSTLMLDSWASFARMGVPAAGWARMEPDGSNVNVLGAPGVLHSVTASVRPGQLAAWKSA
ncbi:MAG: carboxylesterase family protein [Acetobacteraceae bacterium]